MPRRLSSYSAREWLRLRPLFHALKTFRLDRIDQAYTRTAGTDPAMMDALLARLAGRNVVATVAFNAPWTIAWQLRFIERNLRNASFVVADNSSDPKARAAIRDLCDKAGVAWIGLPPNPFTTRKEASRSHGAALNWTYRQVIRPLRPEAWGFFDHDLYPTQPFDPLERLRGQPCYGHIESRPGGTYLWPDYCLFARGVDQRAELDFRQDWFLGLDTGGMNAKVLFDRVDPATLTFARTRSIGAGRNTATEFEELDWLDDCLHLSNASGWYAPADARQRALDSVLTKVLAGELVGPFA